MAEIHWKIIESIRKMAKILKEMEKLSYVDVIEMIQIKSDKKLLAKLETEHSDVKKMKGKVVLNEIKTD